MTKKLKLAAIILAAAVACGCSDNSELERLKKENEKLKDQLSGSGIEITTDAAAKESNDPAQDLQADGEKDPIPELRGLKWGMKIDEVRRILDVPLDDGAPGSLDVPSSIYYSLSDVDIKGYKAKLRITIGDEYGLLLVAYETYEDNYSEIRDLLDRDCRSFSPDIEPDYQDDMISTWTLEEKNTSVMVMTAAWGDPYFTICSYGAVNTTPESKRYADENFEWVTEPSLKHYSYGGGSVNGIVKNISGETFGYAQIEFVLYDSNDNQIGSAIANISNLIAGNNWKFEAVYTVSGVQRAEFIAITAF